LLYSFSFSPPRPVYILRYPVYETEVWLRLLLLGAPVGHGVDVDVAGLLDEEGALEELEAFVDEARGDMVSRGSYRIDRARELT
jgi:hypothetical protein